MSIVLEPTVTASQIDSYQGNANLAFGADGRSLNPGDRDISSTVNSALEQAQARDFQWQVKQHDQRIKDRDATLDLFASAKLDGDVDEADRPALDKLYGEVKDILLANPNIKANPQAYANAQQKIKEYNNLGTMANTREAEFKKMRLDIAQDQDLDRRKKKIEHLDAEINKGIKHMPTPYLSKQSWDDDKISPDPGMITVEYVAGKDANGLPTKSEKKRTNIKALLDNYSTGRLLEGPNKDLPNQIAAKAEALLAGGELANDSSISEANKRIAEINAENNFNPGDKYFTKPIAVKDDNGKWVLDTNPVEIVKKLDLINRYKNETTAAKIDEDVLKGQATVANIEQSKAAAGASRANAAQSYNAISVANAKLPGELKKLDAEVEKIKKEGGDPTSVINQKAYATIGASAIDAFDEAAKSKGAKTASQIFTPNSDGTPNSILGALNLTGNEVLVPVSLSNAAAREMLTINSTTKDGKEIEALPNNIYLIKDKNNPSNNRIVGINKAYTAGNQVTGSYNLNEGAIKLASDRLGNTTGENNPNIQAGVAEYVSRFQTETPTNGQPLSIATEEAIATWKPTTTSDFDQSFKSGNATGYIKNVNVNGKMRKAIYSNRGGTYKFLGYRD